ncbi:trypsin-like peptidase domain-containing protein [Candidatus Parcubacteria bacterium]|nr:trypsin-like peptidase domain-containing protein [Candidatus Parcubacteria bacterium]
MEKQIIATVKKIVPAVISIVISKNLTGQTKEADSEAKKIKTGGGSGFIVDSSGIILTNRHVVNDPLAEYAVVLNNDEKYSAKVLAKDPINDIAVLKIDAKNLPTIKLGDSTKLELGQTVIAVGNVLGAFKNTVSVGIVSGLSREITADSEIEGRITKLQGLIQTDAAINPGNSGGPLTNMKGQAVGINAAMVLGAENIGFTLPINAAKKDLQDIKKYGKIRRPFLGIRYVILNKKLKEKYNFPIDYGALVISEFLPKGKAVIPNSPADKAGIKESDIILEINKKKLSPKKDLENILSKFKINDEIKLKVLRGKEELYYKIVLEEKK